LKKLPGFLTLLLFIVMAASGCAQGTTSTATSPTGGGSGSLIVNATDAPPSHNVTAIIVTVASVRVHMAGATENTTLPTSDNETSPTMASDNTTGSGSGSGTGAGGQWIDIPLGTDAVTFDLLQIQGILHELGSANLTAGTYTQIRLEISSVKVGLNGGAPQDATLPSGVLKVVRPFQVAADMTTNLTLDFAADQMVTVTGNGGVIVKPVIKLSVSTPSPSRQPGQPGTGLTTRPSSANTTPPVSGQTMIPTSLPTPNNK
jgi:hypothetical protein